MNTLKKIIGSLLLLFLLTGCSSEYHLSFEDGKIKEFITFETDSLKNITESDGTISDIEKTDYFAYDEQNTGTKYEKVITKRNNRYHIELHYDHDPDAFDNALAMQYFQNHIFINDSDYYYIHLKDGLLNGMENVITDTVKIHITTNNRVIAENADEIKGNTYSWNITKQNAAKKEIFFQVSKKNKEIIQKGGNAIITGVILLLLLIVTPIILWAIGQKVINKIENKRNSRF